MSEPREIDALIAEHIFGWKWYPIPQWNSEQTALLPNSAAVALVRLGVDVREYVNPCSTDMAAAWTVVEKMHELGFTFFQVTAQEPINTVTKRWLAGFAKPRSATAYWRGADTAPLAICLAALQGVRSKDPA